MPQINGQGLFLIDGSAITHIHTSAGNTDMDALQDYFDEYDLGVRTDRDVLRYARDILYDTAEMAYQQNAAWYADPRHAAARMLNDAIGDDWDDVGDFRKKEYDLPDDDGDD